MAKSLFKVTILFCLIISLFVVPSFADYTALDSFTQADLPIKLGTFNQYDVIFTKYNDLPNSEFYTFYVEPYFYAVSTDPETLGKQPFWLTVSGSSGGTFSSQNYNDETFYSHGYRIYMYYSYQVPTTVLISQFTSFSDGLDAIIEKINQPVYYKNPNVDEFIANTLISMGVKFDTPAYALSYASDAWTWCTDETNMESANPFDEWNINSFVSYCNAQSNNYLNWYNGYKVSKDVTNALGEYIRQNIRLLTGLPAGVTSVTGAYLPIYHYGSGFQSGISSPTAQTFYPAQTITYFNGEYVNETDDISTSQFLYTPADVRRFLGYPGSSPVITPSNPTGTGTITDDPNNPDQKNITINFPALDWLADAIKSILDFLRDAFTTLANLLTQLLDAILGLFSDAFESLSDFGQGIIDWLYAIVAGFSTIGSNYIPASLWTVILPFILINIGVGLIMFVLRSH